MGLAEVQIEGFHSEKHLDKLVETLFRVRDFDHTYPPVMDAGRNTEDFSTWLMEEDVLERTIATVDGEVAGHISTVAAHDYLTDYLAKNFITSPSHKGFSEIGKFFVDPLYRKHGVGKVLFRAAVQQSVAKGYHPALAVVSTSEDAIRFYTREGWILAGTFTGLHGVNLVFYYDLAKFFASIEP